MHSSFFTALLIWPIAAYKRVLSPLLPPLCRFHPSCSVYAMGAISVHGPLRGLWLAVKRLARCHPLGRGGFDPVPSRNGASAVDIVTEKNKWLAGLLSATPPTFESLASSPSAVQAGVTNKPHR
jgi:uncharacterized protein